MSPPMEQTCAFTSFNCVGMLGEGAYCEDGKCILGDIGGGYTDEEIAIELGIESCLIQGFHGFNYMPGASSSGCLAHAYDTCFPVFGLQYESSSYADPNCCFECIGW